MSEEVEETSAQRAWPKDQFHPAYDGFKDWLDAEAPAENTPKMRNRPRFQVIKRRHNDR